jgi:hypothetical protein
MSELKTKRNDDDVDAFLHGVENEKRRRDAMVVKTMLQRLSGEKPKMWGSSIVGFGEFNYRTKAGNENAWFRVGFSPRKQSLTLYIMDGFDGYEPLLARLGNHTTGKSCLYIKDLEAVDINVLEELIKRSLEHVNTL